MSRQKIIFLAGSPSKTSRSTRLLSALASRLEAEGAETRVYSTADFDAEEILSANTANPAIAAYIEEVKQARALVVSSPVYKATFSGALKVLLDPLPQDALVGQTALGIVTGRQAPHLEAAARGLGDIFAFFRIERALPALTLSDERVFADTEAKQLSSEVETLLAQRSVELLA